VSWVGPLAALFTGVALVGALLPFARASRARPQRLGSQREDDRLRLLRALRDLERDRDRGALSETEYERLRQGAEAEAVALIRDIGGKERSRELASALRTSRHRTRRGRRALGPAVLVGTLVAVAAVATTVPLLVGAAGARPAGGFITGVQATPTASSPASSLEQHVGDHPGDIEARLDLAQTYLEAGRPRQASQQYVEVLKRDPDNPEATTRLALLLYEAGDTDDALKGANKVLATHADYPEALFLQGVILLNALNRPKDAIAPLQRYLQVAPDGGYRDDAQQLLREAQAQAG
jgi:cytochrome c-type biogenesis protein CcmH/NrfG